MAQTLEQLRAGLANWNKGLYTIPLQIEPAHLEELIDQAVVTAATLATITEPHAQVHAARQLAYDLRIASQAAAIYANHCEVRVNRLESI